MLLFIGLKKGAIWGLKRRKAPENYLKLRKVRTAQIKQE